jgi:flotillin
MIVWVVPIVLMALVMSAALVVSLQYERVGPNEVLIISGRPATYLDPNGEAVDKNFSVKQGGGTFVVPMRERVDRMSVELMTLEIETPEFHTKFGVPIAVSGIAQIKVRADDPHAGAIAAEMFLSKTEDEMNKIAHQMMQGHLRAVISSMSFAPIHAEPESFARTVHKLTAADLANMGIAVVSLTIREVRDPSGYLLALGRPQMAEARKRAELGEANATRDAVIGKACANREAAVTSAQAAETAKQAELAAALAIAASEAERDKTLHALDSEVAAARAESDMAYELETARVQRKLAEENLKLREIRIAQREKTLIEEVDKPAEAERRRLETLAAAKREEIRQLAEADAEAIRLRGLAEVEVTRAQANAEAEATRHQALAEAEGLQAKLLAEAEGMKEKACAWQDYSAAALQERLIDQLPAVAAAVAAPLKSIDRIVMIGGDPSDGMRNLTRGVTDVIAQLPAVVEAATGVDIGTLMGRRVVDAASKPEEVEEVVEPVITTQPDAA